MPVKRRADKARRAMDEYRVQDLMYGPGACLFGGCGYLAHTSRNMMHLCTEAEQAAVLREMRADWALHSWMVIEAWEARSPHELWCAREHWGSPAEPWALREFGEP